MDYDTYCIVFLISSTLRRILTKIALQICLPDKHFKIKTFYLNIYWGSTFKQDSTTLNYTFAYSLFKITFKNNILYLYVSYRGLPRHGFHDVLYLHNYMLFGRMQMTIFTTAPWSVTPQLTLKMKTGSCLKRLQAMQIL